MTKEKFEEIIEKYNLYSFDSLIKVDLKDGASHEAVLILTIPELGKSIDGKFEGLPDEFNLFYVFNAKVFAVWNYDQIEDIICLQQNYLK
jgi:hypothetical protein